MSKSKTKYVMVCPKCKSPDIYRDNSNVLSGAVGLPSMWICNKCEFSGYTFPEVDINELEGFEEKIKEKGLSDKTKSKTQKVDASYGKGIVKGYWKILGPLMLLFGFLFVTVSDFKGYGVVLLIIGSSIVYFSYIKK